MGKQWEDLGDSGPILTIATNAIASHHQQANETYDEERQIFKNDATMEEALKNQIIETIEDTYISEIFNNTQGSWE